MYRHVPDPFTHATITIAKMVEVINRVEPRSDPASVPKSAGTSGAVCLSRKAEGLYDFSRASRSRPCGNWGGVGSLCTGVTHGPGSSLRDDSGNVAASSAGLIHAHSTAVTTVVCQPDGDDSWSLPFAAVIESHGDLICFVPPCVAGFCRNMLRKAVRMICVSQGTEAAFVVERGSRHNASLRRRYRGYSIAARARAVPSKPGPSWDGVYPSGSYCSMQECRPAVKRLDLAQAAVAKRKRCAGRSASRCSTGGCLRTRS